MARRLGRNDPCPCGSGKKYKKCCLPRDAAQGPTSDQSTGGSAVSRALEWLSEHYQAPCLFALERDYYAALSENERQAIEELPDDLYEMQQINSFEWLIAEGTVTIGKGARERSTRVIDLVLGEGGPLLDARDREYLRTLGETPLKLYEVVEVEPGRGLWLEDAIAEEGARFFVLERSGSQSLRTGAAIGARVLPGEPRILSGAVYPFDPDWFLAVRRAILTGPRGGRRRKIEKGLESRAIIQLWLRRLVQPPPKLVDAATGDPLLFTIIQYRIRDRARVERRISLFPSNGSSRFRVGGFRG
jgi:hypothetical protein